MRKASGKLFCWTQFFSEFFKVVFFFFFAEFLIHLRSACFHEGTRLGGKVVVSPNTKPQQQQHKTQQQQHKTTTTTTKHSEMESFFQLVATRGRDFLQKEIPELLQLLSQSLSKKPPIPLSFAEGSRMSMEDWLSLTPLLTVLALIIIWVFYSVLSCSLSRSSPLSFLLPKKRTYYLTRILLLRFTGCIYLAAFLTSAFQSRPLFGTKGIEPAPLHSSRPTPFFSFLDWVVEEGGGGKGWVEENKDLVIEGVSWGGVLGSLVMVWGGVESVVVGGGLWVMYLSIVNMEGMVIRYGWEWLTLEAGFLSLFLSPLLSTNRLSHETPPSILVLWLYRWLGFRLLFGAGMSKLGTYSSACWKLLTCTTTHYFTQPIPNPLSWFAHHLPLSFHRGEVLLTFLEQLVLPFCLVVPVRIVNIGGALLECFFQLAVVATGNYAWINYMGILPCLSLFDDDFLYYFFPSCLTTQLKELLEGEGTKGEGKEGWGEEVVKKKRGKKKGKGKGSRGSGGGWWRRKMVKGYQIGRGGIYIGLFVFLVCLSAPPVKEMFGPSPWLHYYDDYFFITSQGVFGFINQKRIVLSLSMTTNPIPTSSSNCKDTLGIIAHTPQNMPLYCSDLANHCYDPRHGRGIQKMCPKSCHICSQEIPSDIQWRPIEFRNLPGDVKRMPGVNSPYHYRFDWEVWITTTARLENRQGQLPVPPFLQRAIGKLLVGDEDVISLFGTPRHELLGFWDNSTKEEGKTTSKRGRLTAIKAEWFEYTFSEWETLKKDGAWWERKRVTDSPPLLFTREEDGFRGEGYDSFVGRWVVLSVGCLGVFVWFVVVVDKENEIREKNNNNKHNKKNKHINFGLKVIDFLFFLLSLLFFSLSFLGALLWDYPSLFPSSLFSFFPPHPGQEDERGIGERGIGYGCCCCFIFLFLLKKWGMGLGKVVAIIAGGGMVMWLWCKGDFGY